MWRNATEDTMEMAGNNNAFVKLKLFLSLSRTPHGLLDMCTPLLAAVLWLGRIPQLDVLVLGMIAAFAGYTAVYALNDVIDFRNDRKKIAQSGFHREVDYLDAVIVRHPLAQGFLSLPEAIAWTAGWMLISLTAAFLLNPVCALILVAGCLLEALYCLLLQVSHLRTLVSGVVKTLGGVAAVFAVDPSPDPGLLLLLFCWLFFWEIGGQNVPADWHDIEEDISLSARTVPVSLGTRTASVIVLVTLCVSVGLGGILFRSVPLQLPVVLYLGTLLAGIYLLVIPAVHLFLTRDRNEAAALFNRASYYPCILLFLALAAITW